jgi:hypothetical protein
MQFRDSYKEGLGLKVRRWVPSDPEEYKTWLEKKRQHYQEQENTLEEEVLSVTIQKILDGTIGKFHIGSLDGLEMMPQFWAPWNDL